MASGSGKTCIIGLDGATFTVLDERMAAGDMPNLAGLIERGCRGELISTFPPVTGPGIKTGHTVEANILDVTPTVLHTMGLPVPEYIEGRVLTDLFEADWLAGRPVKSSQDGPETYRDGAEQFNYSQADEQAVTERLRQLGYL